MLYLLATPALALRPTAAHPAAVVRMPASRLAVQPTMVATTPEEKALLAASRCAAPAIPKTSQPYRFQRTWYLTP